MVFDIPRSSYDIFAIDVFCLDNLVIFIIKLRLNILPINFTFQLWNGNFSSECPFCHRIAKSVVLLLMIFEIFAHLVICNV